MLRRKGKLLISIIVIVLVSVTYLNYTGNQIVAVSQNDNVDNNFINLDNATIATSHFTTYLEVTYTCSGGDWRIVEIDFPITLFLSLDNESWIEVDNHTIGAHNWLSNVSGTFRIINSIDQAFPFDIEQGKTLYINIELYNPNVLSFDSTPRARYSNLAIVVPIDIIRPWYFTIDWTLFGIFGSIFVSLFTVFLVSRYNRKRIEKELRAKIKNENL